MQICSLTGTVFILSAKTVMHVNIKRQQCNLWREFYNFTMDIISCLLVLFKLYTGCLQLINNENFSGIFVMNRLNRRSKALPA